MKKKVNKKTYDISSIKRVTKKFLEVSRCSRAKQRQRMCKKRLAISLRVLLHISSMFVSLIRSFHASGKLHTSHPSLKSTIQNRRQSIDRSLYFPRSPRSSSVWCSSNSSTILMNNLFLLPSISGFRKGQSTTTVLLGNQDDLIRAMKRGEVTMMVFADYSNAFDTVRFKSVLTKIHVMGFSKSFLKWMLNYLC